MNTSDQGVLLRDLKVDVGQRYPRSSWTFALTFHNNTSENRWFIIPDPVEYSLIQPRTAPGVKVFQSETSGGPVFILRISSTQDLLGFLLPPGSTLHIDSLKLKCREERGIEKFEVWRLKEILVSGENIESGWLKGVPIVSASGEVWADFSKKKRSFQKLNKNFKSETISYTPDKIWNIPLHKPAPWGTVSKDEHEAMRKVASDAEPKGD